MKLKPMDENTRLYIRKRIIRYRKTPSTRNTLMITGLLIKHCVRLAWNTAHYNDMVDEFERLINADPNR